MKLAVPKESHPQETRVAISPETAKKFRALNLEVVIERGAGARAGFADADQVASNPWTRHDGWRLGALR